MSPPSLPESTSRARSVYSAMSRPFCANVTLRRSNYPATSVRDQQRKGRQHVDDQCTACAASQTPSKRRRRLLQRTAQRDATVKGAQPIRERIWCAVRTDIEASTSRRDQLNVTGVATTRKYARLARFASFWPTQSGYAHRTGEQQRLLQQRPPLHWQLPHTQRVVAAHWSHAWWRRVYVPTPVAELTSIV